MRRRLVALALLGALASTTAWSGGAVRPGAAPWSDGLMRAIFGSPPAGVAAEVPETPVGRDLSGLLLVPDAHRKGTGTLATLAELDARLSPERKAARDRAEALNRARFPGTQDEWIEHRRREAALHGLGTSEP